MNVTRILVAVTLVVGLATAGQVLLQRDTLPKGVIVERDIMITAEDGINLATDIYRPETATGPLPTLLIRLPYGKTIYGEPMWWVRTYTARGYAVVVQDLRGRFGSEGIFAPYADVTTDGATTLDWIAAQPWSNTRVAMTGCSALGEVQLMQAKSDNSNLRALIAQGAGGAIGTGGASRNYFGFFEGGIPTLAATYGWFSALGGKTGDQMGGASLDAADAIGLLPTGTLVSRFRDDPTDYEDFLANFEDAAYWRALGYLTADDNFYTPTLHINTWHDIGVRGTFEAAALMRDNAATQAARAHQHVIIGPGLHCRFDAAFADGKVGDLAVDPEATFDFNAVYAAWLDHWLMDAPLPALAQFTYFIIGADRWDTSDIWPPPDVTPQVWHLSDGRLQRDAPSDVSNATYRYDPADPTPSIGGPICCTGGLDLPAGPLDQGTNAGRDDILAFASVPLDAPLTLLGEVAADVVLSSDAPDTDLVAVLIDIGPDGSLLAIQQGALRLRYRDGFDTPAPPLQPGEQVSVPVTFPPIAYQIAAGHRIGLHLSSASFPRLERNLNTGHPNALADQPRVAKNTVWFGPMTGSTLTLPIQSAPQPPKNLSR